MKCCLPPLHVFFPSNLQLSIYFRLKCRKEYIILPCFSSGKSVCISVFCFKCFLWEGGGGAFWISLQKNLLYYYMYKMYSLFTAII